MHKPIRGSLLFSTFVCSLFLSSTAVQAADKSLSTTYWIAPGETRRFELDIPNGAEYRGFNIQAGENEKEPIPQCPKKPDEGDRCAIQWSWWTNFSREGNKVSMTFVNEARDRKRLARFTIFVSFPGCP
jgi:hypothetical protein